PPKSSVAGETVSVPAPAPVPASATVAVGREASSLAMIRADVRAPVAVGAKRIVTTRNPAVFSVKGVAGGETIENGAATPENPVIVSGPLPRLTIVTLTSFDWVNATLPKSIVAGETSILP